MKINHTVNLAPQISLRWLTIACFELRIGNFSVVIDPCIGASPRAGFSAEIIEKADVMLLSHGHWDHITDIKALMDSLVLCGELTAPALLRYLNCNPKDVYPVAPDLELDFDGAKIRALFGRHCNQGATLADKEKQARANPKIDTPEMLDCSFFGNMEYRNYLVTTPSGLKVMFWGNDADAVQRNIIRRLQPDIALLQYTRQKPEELAQMVAAGNVKVLIPHHMDLFKDEQEYEPLIEILEQEVHKVAPDCLVLAPERLKWYTFGMTVSVNR